MALCRIIIKLHQMGIDTRSYKNYVFDLQDELDENWLNHIKTGSHYRMYLKKLKSSYYDFSGEYNMAIRQYHMRAKEAYQWVLDEFINK